MSSSSHVHMVVRKVDYVHELHCTWSCIHGRQGLHNYMYINLYEYSIFGMSYISYNDITFTITYDTLYLPSQFIFGHDIVDIVCHVQLT